MKDLLRRLRRRLRRHRPPRPWRPGWLPKHIHLHSEAALHPHVAAEQANLFMALDAGSTELEVLNWLHSTVILLKPSEILETGAFNGYGTVALAAACRANGRGRVHSVELDEAACARACRLLDELRLSQWVSVHCSESRAFLRRTSVLFDFAFFDSACEVRAEECAICMERGILQGPAVFHDTSALRTLSLRDCPTQEFHSAYRRGLEDLAARYFEGNIFASGLSRGLTVLFPKHFPVLKPEPAKLVTHAA